MATKVLIVDDHPVVREGLTARITVEPDLEVCGEAADISGAMALVRIVTPDVVVVDIQLGTECGLDLIARLKAQDESIRVLVCSMYSDDLYAQRALRLGAFGYINKQCTTHCIVKAIRWVCDGRIYLSDDVAARLLTEGCRNRQQDRPTGVESLSNRELEVFRLIGQGLASSQIASRLSRSTHTVEAHRQAIKRKLNLRTAAELYRSAVQWVLQNG